MTGFLTPLMPLLLVLLHPDASFSSSCPKDCTCSPADSTMCFQRRSSSMPTGVSSITKNLYLFANGIESLNTDDFQVVPSPGTKDDAEEETHFCPSDTCLNGGTCRLVGIGQIECMCPRGFTGLYCEMYTKPAPPPERMNPQPTVTVDTPDISSHHATPTSILLDLHRYFELRPKTRAIRLTYRNLSGPDRRPMQLNLPASHPEYVLRGLKPNSTYSVCASPLSDPSGTDKVCIEAQTTPEKKYYKQTYPEKELTTMIIPAVAILLLLVLVAVVVGVMCYLRKKKAKGHLELECEPSQLELDGVKPSVDNGALPQKQPQIMIPEPAVQNGNVEYEPRLWPGAVDAAVKHPTIGTELQSSPQWKVRISTEESAAQR
uniref:EGF-like domain-containing protein n=1 Tax=Knipowitschia caucasica TaxID=637954 RepID=A0AAV2KEF9_KNICA